MSTVSEIIMSEEEFIKASPMWVSVYKVQSLYGGPEEGGWFYDVWELVGGMKFPTEETANAYLTEAEAKAKAMRSQANADYRAMYEARYSDADDVEDDFCSGESTGPDDFRVVCESRLGERDNTSEPPPHWE